LTTQPKARGPVRPLVAGVLVVAALAARAAPAQETRAPEPPSSLTVADVPNDAGSALTLSWRRSPDDSAGRGLVTGYVLERATAPDKLEPAARRLGLKPARPGQIGNR